MKFFSGSSRLGDRLKELHRGITEGKDIPQNVEKIANEILREPIKQKVIDKDSDDYNLLKEWVWFEHDCIGMSERTTGGSYSAHTDMVAKLGADFCILDERTHELDLAFLLYLKGHDLIEMNMQNEFDSFEDFSDDQLAKMVNQNGEKLANRFLEHVKRKITLTTRLESILGIAINLIKHQTFLRPDQYFTVVDDTMPIGDSNRFDPRLVLGKIFDRCDNMMTLDRFRTISDNDKIKSLSISSENLDLYPILERLLQEVKSIYLLNRDMACISSLPRKAYLRGILIDAYGGIKHEQDPIRNPEVLKQTQLVSVSQCFGLFGASYLEIIRCIETLQHNNPMLRSTFDSISDGVAAYPRLDKVTEPSQYHQCDGTFYNLLIYKKSGRKHGKNELQDPCNQYRICQLFKRIFEERLIDPTIDRSVKGLHAENVNVVFRNYHSTGEIRGA